MNGPADADETRVDGGDVVGAVRSALAVLALERADLAAQALAVRLAATIDAEESGRTVSELARQLLAVLESLGATRPRAARS